MLLICCILVLVAFFEALVILAIFKKFRQQAVKTELLTQLIEEGQDYIAKQRVGRGKLE